MLNGIRGPMLRSATGSAVKIEVDRDLRVGGYRVFIFGYENTSEKKCFAVKEVSVEQVSMYEPLPSAIDINEEEAQGLMESLWKAGIRPRSGEGSVGQLGATERHLADMRSIVSKKLDVMLP
jgi:hypothetical protein